MLIRDELFCRGRVPLNVLFPRNLELDKPKHHLYHISYHITKSIYNYLGNGILQGSERS